jgi:succinyl-diaminopimelate desuccinylase
MECQVPGNSTASTPIDADALVEFTRALVRIPSVYDPARGLSEAPAAELVEAQMRTFGWDPRVELVDAGRPNVIATIDGDRPGRTLLFEGHTDVVTEGDAAAWSVDPFGAELRDGRIYGRGSADMKSGVAAMLFAADAVARSGPFPGRIVVAALVDEEGMMSGVRDFVARGHAADVDGGICCEPEGGEICHAAKGALRLRIDLQGKMAHGAMPFEGRNPNRAAAAVIAALSELEQSLQQRHGTHEHLGQPWVTPTVLRAGEPVQMNVMPEQASVWVDVRTIPTIEHKQLLGDVTALAEGAGAPFGVTASITVIDDRPAVEVAPESPLVRAVWDAHAAVATSAPRLGGVPGTTDGTMLSALAGVPTVVYGPGGKWIAHQADEYVDVSDIVEHANVYVEAARRYLDGVPGR